MSALLGEVQTALLGVVGVVVGLFGGYWLRGNEFRRDQRLRIYSEFVAGSIDTATAGTGLQMVYLRLGPEWSQPDNRARSNPSWMHGRTSRRTSPAQPLSFG